MLLIQRNSIMGHLWHHFIARKNHLERGGNFFLACQKGGGYHLGGGYSRKGGVLPPLETMGYGPKKGQNDPKRGQNGPNSDPLQIFVIKSFIEFPDVMYVNRS